MTVVTVSLSEIRREGPWALRALGFPFGIADRATPMLVWTEAVHGAALAWLRAGETAIAASTGGPAAARSADPARGRLVDAGGRCLLEVGPPALDLATRDARCGDVGHVELTNVRGLIFSGALCDLAVSRGLGVVAVHASGAGEIAADRFATRGWIVGGIPDREPVFLASAAVDDPGSLLPCLARAGFAAGAATLRLIEGDLERARAVGAQAGGYLGLTLVPAAGGVTSAPARSGEVLPVVDWPERVERARRDGVAADPADLRHLYALEERTWAPTSERSRRQAAF